MFVRTVRTKSELDICGIADSSTTDGPRVKTVYGDVMSLPMTKAALPSQSRYVIYLHKHDGSHVVNSGLLYAYATRGADGWVICNYRQIVLKTRAQHCQCVVSHHHVHHADRFCVSTQDQRMVR
jgi:hypothetical protein